MPNYEWEWSQPRAVEMAFLAIKENPSDAKLREILKDLWQTGCAYGYNYG